MAESQGDRVQAATDQAQKFARTKATDVTRILRQLRIDVKESQITHHAGKTFDQRLHHQTLAVDRWRGVRENEELHLGLESGAVRERVRRTT